MNNLLSIPPSVTQNIARSKAYLKREEPARAIQTMLAGLNLFEPEKIIGKARFETEVLIEECIAEMNRNPKVRKILEAFAKSSAVKIVYKPGEEKKLIQVLTVLHKALEQAEAEKHESAQAQKDARRAELWEKGSTLLAQGDAPRGKAMLRRLADEFGREDGVLLKIGKLLLDAKLYFEAQEFLEQALEAFPKQGQTYTALISCYMAVRELEKAEKTYEAAVKQFGTHPKTLLNFARFYLEWNKRDKAAEYAMIVLRNEPDNAEAQDLLDKAERKK